MFYQKTKSTFLIKSQRNKSFGTGFCIYKDNNGSFIITCAHVADECGHNDMTIEGMSVKLKVKSNNQLIDLALLYVKDLTNTTPLNTDFSETLRQESTPLIINGFKAHKKDTYKLETIYGEIEKVSSLHQDNQFLETYELRIKGKDNIEKGYSGSAVICTKSNRVIAIATDRNVNGKEVYAIPLYQLKSIWLDMPKSLLSVKKSYNFKQILPFGIGLILLISFIMILPKMTSYFNQLTKTKFSKELSKRFIRNNVSEVVIDHKENLMWQDDVEAKSTQKPFISKENYDLCLQDKNSNNCNDFSGDTASTYCDNLTSANHYNWRLPTTNELKSIVDLSRLSSPFIQKSFQSTYPNTPYWTSQQQESSDNSHAWGIDFDNKGIKESLEKQDSYTVRCVRDIK